MIVLDENIPEDQRQLLRGWRVRVHQIGEELERKGMKDDQILSLLLKLSAPTFDFWNSELCHDRYCLVVLELNPDEAATFVRRILRHRLLKTKAKRLGRVIRVDHLGMEILAIHEPPVFHSW